jgi:propanol-preferring alcohol dehydrogenase
MKGWQFVGTDKPLQLVEQEEPKAKPGYVVVDVKAAGICHSDVGMMRDPGWMDLIGQFPVIMGHEVAGVVSEIGEGVTEYKVGDKVAICPTGPSGVGAPGHARDGGFADKTTAPVEDLVLIPEGLSFAMAAAGTDAGMTSYHAVFSIGQAEPGQKIGIIGVGGLGQIALQAAVAKDLEVYAVDNNEKARKLALEFGAKEVVADVKKLAEHHLDLIVDYAGFGTTTSDALNTVTFDGRVVLVGMGKLETTVNTSDLITGQKTLHGSVGGNKQDMAEIYELMQAGGVKPKLTEITFDEIPEGIERLENNEVSGRLVAVFD